MPRLSFAVTTCAAISMILTLGTAFGAEPIQPAAAGWWKLDEGQGTAAADASGAGNAGTLQPGATWCPGQGAPFCLSLPGSATGFVDVPAPAVDTSSS